MGTIPAPNIADAGGEIVSSSLQVPNALAEYTRVAGLKQQQQQQAQSFPLEQQQRQQQIEMQRRQMADQDALTKAITAYDPAKHTLADIPKLVTQNGGSGQAALQAQTGLITQRQNLSKLTDEQFAQEQKKADLIQGVHDTVSQAPAEQKQNAYTQGLQQLSRAGVDVSKESPQYPGDEAFAQHLAPIRLHSAIIAESEKDRELATKEQEAIPAEEREFQPYYKAYLGANNLQPSAANELAARDRFRQQQHPLPVEQTEMRDWLAKNPGKTASDFMAYKAKLVPAFNFQLQAGGVPGTGAAPSGPNGTPLSYADQIKSFGAKGGVVKSIIEGRQDPPGSFAQKTPYWQDVMQKVYAVDPEFNQQRAQLRKDYTVGKHSTEINAINTATGHLGELNDAIDALNNGNIPILNAIANRVGVELGATPKTTLETIVHRVGPEISKAYLGAGGSAGERGSDEKDFDPAKGNNQLKANAAITAKLLRSKVAGLQNQWDQNKAPSMPSFQDQFISPAARAVLDKLSPQAQGGAIRARDPQGRLHEAPAGTALPQGWTLEQ